MENVSIINQIRAFHFILGVLKNQQDDPNCMKCLSFAKNVETVKNRFIEFEKSYASKKEDFTEMFQKQLRGLYELFSLIQEPDNPIGQRKVGNCNFPEKICIIQESISIFNKAISST